MGSGIHWHMNLDNQIEYIATDAARGAIPYVKFTGRDGSVREYRVEGTTEAQLRSLVGYKPPAHATIRQRGLCDCGI